MFDYCDKLVEIEGVESLESEAVIRMEECHNLGYDFRKRLLQVLSLSLSLSLSLYIYIYIYIYNV
jgi:hypothetical protein